jgi:sugar lactone lactonase YvrE
MTDFVVKNGLQIGGGSKLKSGTIAGNATLDLTTGNFFSHTPTADTTFVFSNPPAAGKAHGFALKVTGADLGVSYDLANASYDSVSFSFAAQETSPSGVFFKPDGTKMYVVGSSGMDVNEYNLSTAWDVSTASFLQNFSVSSQEATPEGIFFKPDGTKMYIIGSAGDDVNEYNLSTAWDVSTATYLQNFSVASKEDIPMDLFFRADGTVLYIVGLGSRSVHQYNLTTAWDISTASFSGLSFFLVQDNGNRGLWFKDDGTKMYVLGLQFDVVYSYSLSTAWSVNTASYDNISFSVAGQESAGTGIFFKPDGTKMYIVGIGADTVFQYTTGASDVATFTYPASVKFPNGTPPTAPAVGETDVLTFYTDDGGTTYSGFQAGDAMQ